ncbi:MAG: hypothetical protein QOE97_1015 [Pseudonocardiales bacterium]|jgi:hypothetical protein|nr:hypothetical protein [Pseudonocardiales bacterium]
MRWSRPQRRASLGIAAGLAALAATAALALTRNGGAGSAPLPLAALSSLGRLRPIAAVGPLGPEGVPIPKARALAGTRLLTSGEQVDGIACQAGEQVLLHIHAHLTIFVRGVARQVPAAIGIAPPYQVEATPRGAFIAGASCFMWLHTHSADGIIHTESPVNHTSTLGEFFDIWGQPFDREQVGPAHGPVTALFNGRVFTGNPREIPLLAHAQIQLEVGRPLVAPEQITLPNGL